MEGMNQFPKKLEKVPNEPLELNAEGYQKLSVVEAMSGIFSQEEAANFSAMSVASSQEDLNDAIAAFNQGATKKEASEYDMSLEDMFIEEQPITLANGFSVIVSRSRGGLTQFKNPANA